MNIRLNAESAAAYKRCVIYCRKSSSEGLDRNYTSIDAQRDTCLRFIENHASDGWQYTGQVFEDGGFSGGTTDRPAFQRMMRDVRNGEIDIIVIYKLDRINRNKRDFWNIEHELRQHGVEIVCATQSIELKTSTGRATTGIMMDFAELEREMDSERILGQLRAARAAGRWSAAATPYGYKKNEDSELVVDETKAESIRFIFERYPIIKSAKQVAKELNDRFGPKEPGTPWLTRHVYKILQNIAYKGLVAYEGVEYKGIYTPLVTSEQWALARKVAAENTTDRESSQRMQSIAEFRGILKCVHCNCLMTPGYTMKAGRRFIYYRCVKDHARAVLTCPVRQNARRRPSVRAGVRTQPRAQQGACDCTDGRSGRSVAKDRRQRPIPDEVQDGGASAHRLVLPHAGHPPRLPLALHRREDRRRRPAARFARNAHEAPDTSLGGTAQGAGHFMLNKHNYHYSVLTSQCDYGIMFTIKHKKGFGMVQTRERTAPTGVNFSIRMNSELKTQSEDLFRALGMNMTTAIQIFLKKAVSVGGLPFDVRVPNYNPETLEAMRETEEIGNDPDRRGMPLDMALAELKR